MKGLTLQKTPFLSIRLILSRLCDISDYLHLTKEILPLHHLIINDMRQTFVTIEKEVPHRTKMDDDWTLHFQKVVYHHGDGTTQKGFRFIWRRPDGSLQAARGQARIPGKEDLMSLIAQAEEQGFFDYED